MPAGSNSQGIQPAAFLNENGLAWGITAYALNISNNSNEIFAFFVSKKCALSWEISSNATALLSLSETQTAPLLLSEITPFSYNRNYNKNPPLKFYNQVSPPVLSPFSESVLTTGRANSSGPSLAANPVDNGICLIPQLNYWYYIALTNISGSGGADFNIALTVIEK